MRRWGELWWNAIPSRAARLSMPLGVVLRDGDAVRLSGPAAALAPPLALVAGFAAGWRHPLATDVYTTSVVLMCVALAVGVLSAALGVWLVFGYALGDIFLGVRGAAFGGGLDSVGRTWAAALLSDLVLAVLVVLIPLTARVLAEEAAARWPALRSRPAVAALAALAGAALAYAWAQAALVLTRPFFSWHGLGPSAEVIDALHLAAVLLPLIAAVGIAARLLAEDRLAARVPPLQPLPERAARPVPAALSLAGRVLFTVFLLAGLMESWIDPIVVAALMALLLLVREPVLRRLGSRAGYVMRYPILPRLLLGAVISAIVGIIVVSALGTVSVVRPVVISTLVSLVVFSLLLPDRVLAEPEAAG